MKISLRSSRIQRIQLVPALLLSALAAGCADAEEGGAPPAETPSITVRTPAELATESADSYDDNEFGIVSGTTLSRWLDDWEANRPDGITGRLIVLQQDSREGATAFVRHDGEHVFTYGFAEYAYADSQRRNNGLLDTFVTIPDGENTDAILNEFDIDLSRDLVVFAFVDKDAVPGAVVDAPAKATKVWYNTRSWWWLRYWGADARHLALLDGAAAEVLDAEYIVEAPSEKPATPGNFSVKQLKTDNTSLKIDVGGLIDLVRADGSDFKIVDPRRSAEYSGTPFASPANPVNGKRPVAEGRVRGARFLPWQLVLDGVGLAEGPAYATDVTAAVEGGLRFKPKSQLREEFDDDALLDYDSADPGAVTIHYCGHGRRASTWAFVSLGVLGVPARLYDGSWVEWGNLSGGSADDGSPERPLPEDSRWRTDLAELSEHGAFGETPIEGVVYNQSTGADGAEASADGLNIDPGAAHSRVILDADAAYKR